MRGFLAGLLVGIAVALLLARNWGGGGPARAAADRDAVTRTPEPAATPPPPPPPPQDAPAAAPATPPPTVPVDDEAVGDGLRIGDGLQLAGARLVRRPDPADVDVYCDDLRHAAWLRTRHGAAHALLPLLASTFRGPPSKLAASVADAPEDFPSTRVELAPVVRPDATGVVLVRDAAGRAFKVWIEELVGHQDALQRRVRVGVVEVGTRRDGGIAVVETKHPDLRPEISPRTLVRLHRRFRAIPGSATSVNLVGTYTPPGAGKRRRTHDRLYLPAPVVGELEVGFHSGAIAAAGLAPGAVVTLGGHAGMAVPGDLHGTVQVGNWAALHVGGDLSGRVELDTHGTVIVDGDVTGTVTFGTWSVLLVRGRLLGTLAFAGTGAKVWIERLTRAEIAAMRIDAVQAELHVRACDLPAGRYENLGGWHAVFVAEDAWDKLGR